MKRKSLSIVVIVLIFALMAMPVSAAKPDPLPLRVVDTVADSVNPANNYATDLMAGKDTAIGIVYIDAYENNTYEVRYKITESDWYLTEIHFEAINGGDEVFIENKGTLIPGKFTAKYKFELADKITEYSFLYTSGEEVISFAAHAVVGQQEVTLEFEYDYFISSDTDTLFNNGIGWVPSILAWTHSAWTGNFDAAALTVAGAEWIWESEYAANPRTGDIVEFMREFYVQGIPTAATLEITADNEYVGNLNGNLVTYSDTTWTNVETYDVLGEIVTGQNFLNIEVENIPWDTDNPEDNPGGLLYTLVVESTETIVDTPEIYESAWGAGEDAETSNWSMIIPNTAPLCVSVDLIPAFEMFPGSVYDTGFTNSYADAEGTITICKGEMNITTRNLVSGNTYTVYFDTNGVTQGVATTAGPWVSEGTFIADSNGDGTWTHSMGLSSGIYTYSVFINCGPTMLISYDLNFVVE